MFGHPHRLGGGAGAGAGSKAGGKDGKGGDDGPLAKIVRDTSKLAAEQVKGLSTQVRERLGRARVLDGAWLH